MYASLGRLGCQDVCPLPSVCETLVWVCPAPKLSHPCRMLYYRFWQTHLGAMSIGMAHFKAYLVWRSGCVVYTADLDLAVAPTGAQS